MSLRFFGSPNCKDCLQIFVWLEQYCIKYKYYDGHDIENDDVYNMCEEQNINELPHLQLIDNSDQVISEHIGPIEEKTLLQFCGFPTK